MSKATTDNRLISRRPNIEYRKVGSSGFLADQTNDTVYYLNQTSSAIWHYLEQSATMQELISTLQTAFPETPGLQIEEDVKSAFNQMIEKNLIAPCLDKM
ncbi:MAG: PqqD family protein [Sedimenticola sp.]